MVTEAHKVPTSDKVMDPWAWRPYVPGGIWRMGNLVKTLTRYDQLLSRGERPYTLDRARITAKLH